MTKIIAFSGRKQSGKSTAGEYIEHLIKTYNLPISYKLYSFADPLKQDICMNLLGLSYEQCYGDDNMKNSLTELRWEDMPGVLTPDQFNKFTRIIRTPLNSDTLRDTRENMDNIGAIWPMLLDPVGPKNGLYQSAIDNYGIIVHKSGFMTAREVMEVVGTKIFRKIKHNIWVDATINKIKKEQYDLAILLDNRFPNEVDAVLDNNGVVIRLSRNPFNSDSEPETALDPDKYDWSKFSLIINNENLSIEDKNNQIYSFLKNKGLLQIK